MALEYRIYTDQLEILRKGATATPAQVSTVQVEVLRKGAAAVPAQVSQIGLEVLRSVASVAATRRRIPMIHSF